MLKICLCIILHLSAFPWLALIRSICELDSFSQIWRQAVVFIFCLILILSLFVHNHESTSKQGDIKREKSSNSCLCAPSGVNPSLGATSIRRSVVTVIFPGRSEPCRGRDRVRGRGVTEALVPPTGGRGGRHRCGCHRNRVLGGCCEETGVLGVLRSSYHTKVHLVGTTQ